MALENKKNLFKNAAGIEKNVTMFEPLHHVFIWRWLVRYTTQKISTGLETVNYPHKTNLITLNFYQVIVTEKGCRTH